jgi:hypothetical protein
MLRPGAHVYHTFRSDNERYEVLARFVREGLERHERVFYFAHRHPVSTVLAALDIQGVEPGDYIESGALHLGSASESYLAGGRFDPEGSKRQWRRTIDEACASGYAAVRVAADMSWALDGIPGSDRLLEYEAGLCHLFGTKLVTGMCEFDARLFGSDFLRQVDVVHHCHVAGASMV